MPKYSITNVYRNQKDELNEQVENIYVNRRDLQAFRRRLQGKKFDIVIDLAAFSAKDVHATSQIISTDRYVLFSSCAVYGDVENRAIDEQTPLSFTC